MDIMRLSKEEADAYVLNILKENIDCTDKLCIITSLDNNKVHYQLEDESLYHENSYKRITPLGYLEYIMLLKTALAKKGYDHTFIKPIIRNGSVKYEISFRLLENVPFGRRRKK